MQSAWHCCSVLLAQAEKSAATGQQKKVQANVTQLEYKRLQQAGRISEADQALAVMQQLQQHSQDAESEAQNLQASLLSAQQEAQEAAIAAEVTSVAAAARQEQLCNVQLSATAAAQASEKLQQLLAMHTSLDELYSQAAGVYCSAAPALGCTGWCTLRRHPCL